MNEWRIAANAALSEVRRLASDGMPVMTRNVVPYLLADSEELEADRGISTLQCPDAATFSKSWGHRMVDVSIVSYAKNFETSTKRMVLKDYDATAVAAAAAPAETTSGKRYAPAPDFVFQRDTEVVGEGRELLGKFVEAALPSSGCNHNHLPGLKRPLGAAKHAALPRGSLERQPLSHALRRPQHGGGRPETVVLGDALGCNVDQTAHSGVHWREQGQALEGFRSAPGWFLWGRRGGPPYGVRSACW